MSHTPGRPCIYPQSIIAEATRLRDNQFEWTDDRKNTLRALWFEGWPTAEIGRRMGCSKGTIIGKAHRLKLLNRRPPTQILTPEEKARREEVRTAKELAKAQRKIKSARDKSLDMVQKRKRCAIRKIRYWTEILEQLEALKNGRV